MRKNKLSIVIPTLFYNKYLDEAIESCFEAKYIEPDVYVNMNTKSEGFQKSKYWNSPKVRWRNNEKTNSSMYENVNDAIIHCKGDWLFVLSDDDIILPHFLKGVDLSTLGYNDLYLTRIDIINETGKVIRISKPLLKNMYNSREILDLFFSDQIQHHLSFLVFSRAMYEKVGGFPRNIGYPNGYYGDTIFHGKSFANCNFCYTASEVVFSRRETSTQGSAKFYFDNVNDYFGLITDEFFSDKKFRDAAIMKYRNKREFCRNLMRQRFRVEYYKLSNSTFNKSWLKKIEFFYKQLFWDTGVLFKILTPLIMLKHEISKRGVN